MLVLFATAAQDLKTTKGSEDASAFCNRVQPSNSPELVVVDLSCHWLPTISHTQQLFDNFVRGKSNNYNAGGLRCYILIYRYSIFLIKPLYGELPKKSPLLFKCPLTYNSRYFKDLFVVIQLLSRLLCTVNLPIKFK